MKRTNTMILSDVLKDFFQENPLLAEKLAERRLISVWEKQLGHLTIKYTTSLYIKNRTLHVRLSSAVLRNELSMCRDQLISNLNKEVGANVIDNIILSE